MSQPTRLFVVQRLSPSGKTWTDVADAKSLNRAFDHYTALTRSGDGVYRLRRRQQKDVNGRVTLKAHTFRTSATVDAIAARTDLHNVAHPKG